METERGEREWNLPFPDRIEVRDGEEIGVAHAIHRQACASSIRILFHMSCRATRII